jgi:integrase
MTKRNSVYYMDRRLPVVGRVNRSLETKDANTARYREQVVMRLADKGRFDVLEAFARKAFGAARLTAAVEDGAEAIRRLVEWDGDPRVIDIVDDFVKFKSLEIKTADRYGRSLKSLVQWKPELRVSQLNSATIEAFKKYRYENGVSPDAVARDFAAIAQLLSWKVGKNRARQAFEEVKWPKPGRRRTRRLTPVEIQKLLESVQRPKAKGAFYLMLTTGLRPSEAERVTAKDLDRGRMVLRVEDSKTATGIREVPVTTAAADIIEKYGTFDLTYKDMGRIFVAAAKKVGVPNVKLRDLRRTHLQYCRLTEKDVVKARDHAGHTSVEYTERYIGESKVEEHRGMVESAVREMGLT